MAGTSQKMETGEYGLYEGTDRLYGDQIGGAPWETCAVLQLLIRSDESRPDHSFVFAAFVDNRSHFIAAKHPNPTR